MNRKSKIIVSVVGISIVLLALLGITYAYYLTRIEGNTNTNSISVSTADLKLKYDDGTSKLVTKEDIMPGTVIEKDFKVTNEGQSKVNGYVVVLEDIDNTLTRHSDLVYKIECKLNDATSCGFTEEVIYPYDRKLAVIFTNDIDVGVTHNYTLTVTYKNLTDTDQSDDMGKMFDGRVNIMDANNINPYTLTDSSKNETSLVYNIINNAKTNANGTTYSPMPKTIPGREISQYALKVNVPSGYTTLNVEEVLANELDIETYNGNVYYVYSDSYTYNEESKCGVLVNPKIMVVSDKNFDNLIGKYIRTMSGYSDEVSAQVEIDYNETMYCSDVYKVGEESNYPIISAGKTSAEKESTERTLSITQDNLGISYYFRGGVQDNYVLFNNMCFRIVRIEGDGSVKLIFAGDVTAGATNCNEVGTDTGLVKETGSIKKVLYGSKELDGIYYANYKNYENGLEDAIETWYTSKFNTDVLKGKLKNDKWCLGGSRDYIYDDDGNMYTGQELEDFFKEDEFLDRNNYAAGNRVSVTKTTSLMCENEDFVESKYGTITSDEVMLAGGTTSSNTTYYLYENAHYSYWTLSLSDIDNDDFRDIVTIFCVHENGRLDWGYVDGSILHDASGVRPSITLIPGTTITGGVGTKGNPYVIN